MSIQAVAWVLEVETTTSGADRLVLLAIANHASLNPVNGQWEAWPSKRTIGREANIPRAETVREALARLEKRGLLVRTVNAAPDTRHPAGQSPNLYRLVGPPSPETGDPANRGPSPKSGPTPPRKPGTPPSPQTGDLTVSSNHQEPSHLTLAVPEASEPDAFDHFWSVYPRKTDKGGARKAWPAALRRASASVIVAGAERFRDDPNREEQFTPYPATWLRGERWADPPLPSRASRGSAPATKPLDEDRDRPSGRLYL